MANAAVIFEKSVSLADLTRSCQATKSKKRCGY